MASGRDFPTIRDLMKGERLSFAENAGSPGSPVLTLDYTMHLRLLLLLSPENKLLQRTAAIIAKRHAGIQATGITASCDFLGNTYSRYGSLLTNEADT